MACRVQGDGQGGRQRSGAGHRHRNHQRVGYDPQALGDMLRIMGHYLVPGRADFARTHPAPESRIAEIEGVLGPYRPVMRPAVRQRRFEEAMAGV